MSEKLLYKVESFEGPMDLLLNLIAKNKLNIYDIPIATLLEQYMEQIETMENQNMDVASEFLEMAARLVYIKSLSLLPKQQEQEELKQELQGQLLEYKQCKFIVELFKTMVNMDNLVKPCENIEIDRKYKRKHHIKELAFFYTLAVGRGKRFLPPQAEKFSGIVATKIVSVASQVVFVLRKLWKSSETTFQELFKDKTEKTERVATFLALLSLIKSKRVRIEENENGEKLKLIKNGGENANS